MGIFGDDYENVCKYALTKDEIKENKELGLINKNIESIAELVFDYYQNGFDNYKKLHDLGVHNCCFSGNSTKFTKDFSKDSFYITDFFLICCSGVKKDTKPQLLIFPLENIEEMEYKYKDSYNSFISPTFKKEKSGAVKGAIIGGALAGPTGAVVGAVAGNKDKTIMASPGMVINDMFFTLHLKIKDCEKIYYFHYNTKSSGSPNMDSENKYIAELIMKAKETTDPIQRKKKLQEWRLEKEKAVIEDEKRVAKYRNEQKIKNVFIILFVLIIIICIVILSSI